MSMSRIILMFENDDFLYIFSVDFQLIFHWFSIDLLLIFYWFSIDYMDQICLRVWAAGEAPYWAVERIGVAEATRRVRFHIFHHFIIIISSIFTFFIILSLFVRPSSFGFNWFFNDPDWNPVIDLSTYKWGGILQVCEHAVALADKLSARCDFHAKFIILIQFPSLLIHNSSF